MWFHGDYSHQVLRLMSGIYPPLPHIHLLCHAFFEQTIYIHHMIAKFPVLFLGINVCRMNNLVTSVNEVSLVIIKVHAEHIQKL